MEDGDLSYRERLGSLLRRRDPAALRAFLEASARAFGDEGQVQAIVRQSDEELEALMHRMILSRPDLKDLQRASREWLFRRGIDAYGPDGGQRN